MHYQDVSKGDTIDRRRSAKAEPRSELWNRLIKQGERKEPSSVDVRNSLNRYDVLAVAGTLEYFGIETLGIKQAVYDLTIPKFRVFDFLGMGLQGRYRQECEQAPEPERDVFVALANVYLNTTAILQFTNSLKYIDLELWDGKFTSKEFIDYLKRWDKEDVENEAMLAKQAREGMRN
ncbi:MAG: hypothetical protein ABI361_06975 [Nitrososphaera sp.]